MENASRATHFRIFVYRVFYRAASELRFVFESLALGFLTSEAMRTRSEQHYARGYTKFPPTSDWNPEDSIQDLIPWKESTVLDLGAAQGREAFYFTAQGASVVAVESSEDMLTRARAAAVAKNISVDFRLADYESYSPEQQEYDIIYFSSSMYATILGSERRVIMLKKLAGGLKSTGTFIFLLYGFPRTDQLRWGLRLMLARLTAFVSMNPYRFERGDGCAGVLPFHYFTQSEIEKELTAAGLRLDRLVRVPGHKKYFLLCSRAESES